MSVKTAAVICEFNPMHTGHKHLIDNMRAAKVTHIAGIMSGNFVQRGDCAVLNKLRRAECAVKNGIDLVVELPITSVLSSAEGFAEGGVELAGRLRCSELWFGSECNDIDTLRKLIEIQSNEKIKKLVSDSIKSGVSSARALGNAVSYLYGKDLSDILISPNNILGIEYIKAITRLESSIIPKTVKRAGAAHDSSIISGNYASSSYIRTAVMQNKLSDCENLLDRYTYRTIYEESEKGYAPATVLNGERAVIAALRQLNINGFAELPDVTEGLENRLYEAVQKFGTLEEIITYTKSKRYTHARIRRIIMCAYLGITNEIKSMKPKYIRVLAFNDRGAEMLRAISKTTPLVTSPAKALREFSGDSRCLLDLELKASRLWGLMTPSVYPADSDMKNYVRK